MTFELTDPLINDIMFAMENQSFPQVFDASKIVITEASDETDANEEIFYAIPEWTSDDGFALMEEFAERCRSPLARTDLKRSLQGRRGVFRNFKDVLKVYPQIEKQWFVFKNRAMKERILEWYNGLREDWGLELLEDNRDNEETELLVRDDFDFLDYNAKSDSQAIQEAEKFLSTEYEEAFGDELGQAMMAFSNHQHLFASDEDKVGSVCKSHLGEFLGCFLLSFYQPKSKRTAIVTDFFVIQDFRGLGIGRELLNRSLQELKKRGVQWVLFATPVITKAMANLLSQFAFEKIESVYAADLTKF